ncbi:MAG: hypothetical protein MJ233_04305 [Mycoplasmoidaceae bacterium]|nr:hypothetical protein [Mycoplasmoidaceae bacterium]
MIKETTSGEPLVNINIEDAYFDHTNVPDPETQAEEFSNLVHLLHNSGVGMNYSNYFANVPYADFVLIHDYKNDGMYTSVVPPRRVTKLYQEDEAIDAFMFDLSNNNKIFSDDILQYMNLIFIQGIYEDMEDMDIAISISDKVLHEKNYIDIKMITNIVIYRGEGEERRFY